MYCVVNLSYGSKPFTNVYHANCQSMLNNYLDLTSFNFAPSTMKTVINPPKCLLMPH